MRDPERVKAAKKAWAQRNPEYRRAKSRAYKAKNAERLRAQRLEKYATEDKGERRDRRSAYWHENKERIRARRAAHYERNKDRIKRAVRDYTLKRRFGFGQDEYDRMADAQGRLCAICSRPEGKSRGQRLAVDHDHDTGKVRALLCVQCNAGIGSLQDSPEVLDKAAAYLRRHGK